MRTRFLLAQPPASVMPTPKSSPPTSSDSHGSTGRANTAFDTSIRPAATSTAVPTMATATASSHIRMRPQWPMLTMSDSAPMVQKLDFDATKPNTRASVNPPPITRVDGSAAMMCPR